MRGDAGGDGEGHGHGEGDEADGEAGDEVVGEVRGGVVVQALDGAGEPLALGIHGVLSMGLSISSSMERDSLRWAWK